MSMTNKGFSGDVTALFSTMVEKPTDQVEGTSQTEIHTQDVSIPKPKSLELLSPVLNEKLETSPTLPIQKTFNRKKRTKSVTFNLDSEISRPTSPQNDTSINPQNESGFLKDKLKEQKSSSSGISFMPEEKYSYEELWATLTKVCTELDEEKKKTKELERRVDKLESNALKESQVKKKKKFALKRKQKKIKKIGTNDDPQKENILNDNVEEVENEKIDDEENIMVDNLEVVQEVETEKGEKFAVVENEKIDGEDNIQNDKEETNEVVENEKNDAEQNIQNYKGENVGDAENEKNDAEVHIDSDKGGNDGVVESEKNDVEENIQTDKGEKVGVVENEKIDADAVIKSTVDWVVGTYETESVNSERQDTQEDDIVVADLLKNLKEATPKQTKTQERPKEKGICISEQSETVIKQKAPQIDPLDKGKGKIIEHAESSSESDDNRLPIIPEIVMRTDEEIDMGLGNKSLAEMESLPEDELFEKLKEKLNSGKITREEMEIHDRIYSKRLTKELEEEGEKKIRKKRPLTTKAKKVSKRSKAKQESAEVMKYKDFLSNCGISKRVLAIMKFETLKRRYETEMAGVTNKNPTEQVIHERMLKARFDAPAPPTSRQQNRPENLVEEEDNEEDENLIRKKARVEKDENVEKDDGVEKDEVKKDKESTSSITEEEVCNFIVVANTSEKPLDVNPISVYVPIIDWFEEDVGKTLKIKVVRADKSSELFGSTYDILKKMSRNDLDSMYDIAKKKFENAKCTINEKLLTENLLYMYEPERDQLYNLSSYTVTRWFLFENCGVHMVTTKTGSLLYFLVEKDYMYLTSFILIEMSNSKLTTKASTEMALNLVKKIRLQLKTLEDVRKKKT